MKSKSDVTAAGVQLLNCLKTTTLCVFPAACDKLC